MGIGLDDDEAWAEIEQAHTGIFTSLKKDGWPIPLPVWFATEERRIYLRTPGKAKKIARIRHDDRGTFLVERGESWVELAAVMLPVRASVLEEGPEFEHASNLMSAKYEGFSLPTKTVPDATKRHYSGLVVVRLDPAGPFVSWDNARLRRAAAS